MSREECAPVRDRFSDLYEGAVDDRSAATLRSHLDACSECRDEWTTFLRAADALRAHEIAPMPPRYVDQILVAVDEEARRVAVEPDADDPRADVFRRAMIGAERAPRRRTPMLTHAAALVVGVAAAVVLLPWLGLGRSAPENLEPSGTSPTVESARTVPPSPAASLRLDFASGGGRLMRDGRPVDLGPATAFEPRPGDVLEVAPGEGLSLVLADGAVRIETLPVEAPVAQIIERPVERIRYVSRGPLVSVDGAAFDHALGRFEGLVETVGSGVQGFVERTAPRRRPETAPVTQQTPDAPSHDPGRAPRPDVVEVTLPPDVVSTTPERHELPAASPVAALTAHPEGPFGAATPPVLVRRNGNRLRIETVGAPYVVIPELIAHLDSGDPDIAEAARLRLEEIRTTLIADPDLARRLVDPATGTDDGGTLAFVKGLFGREAPAPPANETESWQAWWERNAIHILDAGTWGTF